MLKKLKKLVFPFIILVLVSYISYKNYTPGTFLSGWDNLHPEFNFVLNIKRSLFASWQEYQGVGLLGGMAHGTDLIRQIILFIFSLVLPISFLRYFWVFLMLFLGPLGVYFFVSDLVGGKKEWSFLSSLISFSSAFLYLFNLSTLQTFFTPFETFVTFYGGLPWLIKFASSYLKEGKRKDLVWYVTSSLIFMSAFYVQTMFIVFLATLLLFIIEAILLFKKKGLVRSTVLTIVTFCINAFWLLPVVYFSATSSSITQLSKINSIATIETQLMNEARGTFGDIATLKGYWFDYYDFGTNGKYDLLFKSWIQFVSNPWVSKIGIGLFILSCLGSLIYLTNKKKDFKFFLPFGLLISYFMLAGVNPPFGGFYSFLEVIVPLFSDIFRNSYTKWSTAASFFYSLGIGFLIYTLTSFIKGKFRYTLGIFVCALVIAGSVCTTFPFFDGELISQRVRVNIPNEYFEVFDYFNSNPHEGRIANLPFYSFWGWNYYSWGYGGSGFLWYGVKNPILDRAFDVWSSYNESFYNEASFALNKFGVNPEESKNEFLNVAKKYDVKYFLVDKNILYPGGDDKNLGIDNLETIFGSSEFVTKEKSFGNIDIYKANFGQDNKSYIQALDKLSLIDANTTYSRFDPLYQIYGNYINWSDPTMFPFSNFDRRGDVTINVIDSNLVFENKKLRSKVALPLIDVVQESFGNLQGYPNGKNCDLMQKGSVEKEGIDGGVLYKAESGGVECDYFYYPTLKISGTYVLRIKGENKAGRPLKMYLQNVTSGKIDMEEILSKGKFDDYFVLYPSISEQIDNNKNEVQEKGYTFNLETRSFGSVVSQNFVDEIEFIPFDLRLLTSLTKAGNDVKIVSNNIEVINVKKIGTVFYDVDLNVADEQGFVVLSQGYDRGWAGFEGRKKLYHTKINSWENGFEVEGVGEKVIFIFYWPQIFEWIGFTLSFALVIPYVFRKKFANN